MSRHYLNVPAAVETVPRNKSVLVAVSGGKDSVCLLHALRNSPFLRRLYVAHIDHGLRKDSKADAKFVAKLAKSYKLKYFLKKLKFPQKGNLENWGRMARYRFFAGIMKREKIDVLVTAHHAQDEVETFFMRILSNKEPRLIREAELERNLLRPFLRVGRKEIDSYVVKHKLKFKEDSTNSSLEYLRNRIRHKLLPILERHFPDFHSQSLAERLRILQEDYEFLDNLCESKLSDLKLSQFGSKAWLQGLKKLVKGSHASLSWRLIERVFLDQLNYRLGYEKSLKVMDFIDKNSRELQLEGLKIYRKAGGLQLLYKAV